MAALEPPPVELQPSASWAAPADLDLGHDTVDGPDHRPDNPLRQEAVEWVDLEAPHAAAAWLDLDRPLDDPVEYTTTAGPNVDYGPPGPGVDAHVAEALISLLGASAHADLSELAAASFPDHDDDHSLHQSDDTGADSVHDDDSLHINPQDQHIADYHSNYDPSEHHDYSQDTLGEY
jgi:hypothetical protein